jgi:type I restriction enzyme S subunit
VKVPTVLLGDIVEIRGGGTPSKANAAFWNGDIPWVSPKDMKCWEINGAEDKITSEAIKGSATNLVPENATLIVNRSGILKHTLPVGIARRAVAINQDLKALIPGPRAHPEYIAHMVKAAEPIVLSWVRATTADNFPIDNLRSLKIPLPSLDEQRRIAAILDKTDALRRQRKRAFDLLDSLSQSIFLEMFGDPAVNPRKYPLKTFGEISKKISDGPFGSNLKSSHYVEAGIRVIRLQNIGVGKFVDEDFAFISNDHFRSLSKHECLPGDVLVGTLGEPNLRACLQPDWLPVALNKADCVQIRPHQSMALPEYVVALINQPSVEKLAHGLMLGQTRTRISMGRLRSLRVPIAPRDEQKRFVEAIQKISETAEKAEMCNKHVQSVFSSLQSRAFSGQL